MGWKNAYFNMVHFIFLFNNIKIVFRAEQQLIQNMHMGIFRNCCLLFRPHLNLPRQVVLIMFHLLPCLTTFNIVGYINESELNDCCEVSSICNSLHIELHLICSIVCALCLKPVMHHTCLCIMPCLCLCIYHVVCFLPVLLLSSGNVAIVTIRSTMFVCLVHGIILLPCGISGKMTATLDLTTIIAMLVASFYRYVALPITCLSSLPNCHEPLTFVTLPSKPLFGYVTALLSPSYSVVSCR